MEHPSNENTPNQQNTPSFTGADQVIISGDNLDVLKLLQGARLDKVKSVYIDPLGCSLPQT